MKVAAVILAAGQGTRMTSDLPKVLHTINGRPMLSLVLDTVKAVPAERIYVVVGYRSEMVEKACSEEGVEFVLQAPQLGTGHAVLQCKDALSDFGGTIVVLNGDVPGLRPETIRDFVKRHREASASATVLTTIMEDPKGYGRIVRDDHQMLLEIVEDKDASEGIRQIHEINSGVFCFEKADLFSALNELKRDNLQNEYYLTDVIAVMKSRGLKVAAHCTDDSMEVAGVNRDEELNKIREYLGRKKS